ncbi:retrovirus-related pol polyprotein from transposon TNT 1-94 [Tanacetum coccineum]
MAGLQCNKYRGDKVKVIRVLSIRVMLLVLGGNNESGQARVVKCYNCQGEGHMARHCTQPKRPRNATWYKEKAMLAEAPEAGQILDEEQLAFLADPGVPDSQAIVLWYLDSGCLKHMTGNRSQLMNFHQRLRAGYGTVDYHTKDGLTRGIPKLKFQKDHLCSACALGKSKKSSHQPKAEDTNQEKLYLLHMGLCGPMRVASINGKMYILVIVDDYSRFTWVRFLRTKDEALEAIIKCIKNIQVRLNATVRNVQTDNGTEFVNQTLREFYENVGISHQTSVARTP